ncbi:BarA sensory histidine kinase (= VarS = GacS) [hydrothermal vent metagenome]|uniref:BarA sensory histidine kinase (= VarS = GacS) n=1 Tax=hydrothermal vent metagenome TaxID=652676 RepID=A0A1W1BWV8_9ZZZZ
MGIKVTIANNGLEAFNLRSTQHFDIIFMDIQMPVMNGIESTHAILEYEKEKKLIHIPIVALTANALKGDKELFLAEGMDDYLSKPIQVHEIEKILFYYFCTEHCDILLCRKEQNDKLAFNIGLNKIGYSVDIAENIEDLKRMLKSNKYKYVLLDKELEGFLEDEEIHDIMDKLAIKSIVFVENKDYATLEDHEKYTRIIPRSTHVSV